MSESHHNRARAGEHANYVLTDIQVAEIKRRRHEGEALADLANEYNQTVANLSLICRGLRRGRIAPEYTMTDRIRIDKPKSDPV